MRPAFQTPTCDHVLVADESVDAEETPIEAAIDEITAEEPEEWHTTIGDVLCIGGIAFTAVRAIVTLFFVPSLIGSNPVLLEFLRGSGTSMLTAGAFARDGRTSLVLAIIAGIVGLGLLNVFYWWGGRRYGNRMLAIYTQYNPRYRRWIARSEKFLARWGGVALIVQYFQPIPNVLIYIGTGMSGLSLRMFVLCNTLGCALWVGLMVGLGYAVGHPAVSVAKKISHYSLLVTLGLIVVAFIFAFIRAARMQSRPEAS